MGLNVLDVETYYDQDYSLKKLTIEEYINDPRFQLMMVGMHTHDGDLVVEDTYHLSDRQIGDLLRDYQIDRLPLGGHNLMFDAAILSWKYGILPPLYIDSMLILRAQYRHVLGSCSLANAVEHFGLGEKGDAVVDAKGKHREDFTDAQWQEYRDYCMIDANLTRMIIDLCLPDFPRDEIKIANRTLRWYTDPTFELDMEMLRDAIIKENLSRQALFKHAGIDEQTLASNAKFAKWLVNQGINPPQKISPSTGKLTYAFAKSDPEFLELKKAGPLVAAAVDARIRAKSRIKETRMERFVGIGERNNGKLPVPLLYSGARTHRFAGLEKINLQNLTHGDACRGSMRAPKGYKVVAADQSQIEARINAVLSGQWDLVQRFREGVDNYSWLAERIYNTPGITKESHPKERKIGKATFLGCGYGMGKDRFHEMMSSTDTPVSKLESEQIIDVYRKEFRDIVQHWYFCGELLGYISGGGEYRHGPVVASFEKVQLPSGLCLHYPGIHKTADGFVYMHWASGKWQWARMYGPKLTENIVQALARQLLCEQQNVLEKRYRVVHQVHDELVFIVPDQQVPEAVAVMKKVMAVPPKWMPDIPLEVEVHVGQNFGECK